MPTQNQIRENATTTSRRFKFGIASLLLLVACFAGLFGGFHIGGRIGRSAGEKQRASELVVPRVYIVGDILAQTPGGPDFDALIEKITDEVEPTSWSELGGPGVISVIDSTQLFVCHTTMVHDKLAEALAAIRKAQREGKSPLEPLEPTDELPP